MYVPTSFVEHDICSLQDMMERHSFALLVSQSPSVPVATHLPLLLDRQASEFGTLVGHWAKSNPQWRDLNQQMVLVVFSGPHCYVSPQWYEAENVVPTWNYLAVHVAGRVEFIEDREQLRQIVRRMVDTYERLSPSPWSMPVEPTPYEDRMLDQIVGFRIRIDSMEGQWKLSQNHPTERRQKVIARLREQGGENPLEIAALMEESLSRGSING
jgi:transcriptional regulator